MSALIKAEFRKLLTTKLWLWLLLGALAFSTLATVFTILADGSTDNRNPELSTTAGLHNLLAGASAGSVLAIVLGAVGMTAEYRHLTATPTFLASPRRGRVVTAKLITYLLVGACYGLASVGLVLAISLPWLSARGVHVSLGDGGNVAVLAAAVAVIAIYALLGVGVGALVRNQIAAVVGTLLYLFVLESLISAIPHVRDYYKYFPGGAASALTQAANANATLLHPWQGGLVLAGYAVLFALLGTMLSVRRDIT